MYEYGKIAAMNAGKSTYLLQVAHNYNEQGQRVALYTAAVDDRYGHGLVTSRLGISRQACVFDESTDFFEALPRDVACVLVDEAQFLSAAQVQQLHRWVHRHATPVMCFGLRSDFRGRPFEGAAWLLALAEDVEEIRTVCRCGSKATMNLRIDEQGLAVKDGAQVEIGGNSRYRQVCARCYYRALHD